MTKQFLVGETVRVVKKDDFYRGRYGIVINNNKKLVVKMKDSANRKYAKKDLTIN